MAWEFIPDQGLQNAAYQSEATLERELIAQKNNDHGRKKLTVPDKMRAFFDRFFGLVS